ncbi:GntR family transcriptional regulator [Pseudomonas citronellolis]|uniref:GntR family transcriptional regulator n=1 Tax=Pseudomonas citronellolis TaxID=53408 RepID=UPI0023E372C6|nr:GntR family transcriptional regulator [Pseudomonas citronellolis]MDF3934957.1 GntR family transcriptional regulator [Pseudomonas citronellolis]
MSDAESGPRRRGQAQLIYEQPHGAILARRLSPAAPLSQETLGRIFHAGPSSVRRALQRLAREGAVEMQPRRMACVAQPNAQRLRQLLGTRLLLEKDILRQLAGRLDEQARQELHGCIDAELACLEGDDQAGLLGHAQRFHLRLAELTGSPLLPELLRQLLERITLNIALGRGQPYTAEACRQQRELLDALAAGAAERACACLEGYLGGIDQRLRFAPPPTTDLHAAFAGKLAIP